MQCTGKTNGHRHDCWKTFSLLIQLVSNNCEHGLSGTDKCFAKLSFILLCLTVYQSFLGCSRMKFSGSCIHGLVHIHVSRMYIIFY